VLSLLYNQLKESRNMDRDDDGETSYNTFVDDVALEPTYLQALPTAAGRNVAT